MAKKQQSTKTEEYDNKNTGALFFNEKKVKASHPDFQGSMTDTNGTEFWVSGWKKMSKSGKKFISLAFTEKEEVTEEDHGSNKKKAADDPW